MSSNGWSENKIENSTSYVTRVADSSQLKQGPMPRIRDTEGRLADLIDSIFHVQCSFGYQSTILRDLPELTWHREIVTARALVKLQMLRRRRRVNLGRRTKKEEPTRPAKLGEIVY
jgi:hypothetical protein